MRRASWPGWFKWRGCTSPAPSRAATSRRVRTAGAARPGRQRPTTGDIPHGVCRRRSSAGVISKTPPTHQRFSNLRPPTLQSPTELPPSVFPDKPVLLKHPVFDADEPVLSTKLVTETVSMTHHLPTSGFPVGSVQVLHGGGSALRRKGHQVVLVHPVALMRAKLRDCPLRSRHAPPLTGAWSPCPSKPLWSCQSPVTRGLCGVLRNFYIPVTVVVTNGRDSVDGGVIPRNARLQAGGRCGVSIWFPCDASARQT